MLVVAQPPKAPPIKTQPPSVLRTSEGQMEKHLLESKVWSGSSHCAKVKRPTRVRLSVWGPPSWPSSLEFQPSPCPPLPRRKALSYLAPESPGFIPPHPNTAFVKTPFLRVCGSTRKPILSQPDSLPCFALRTFTL